jgi:haloalkane dehalogenase
MKNIFIKVSSIFLLIFAMISCDDSNETIVEDEFAFVGYPFKSNFTSLSSGVEMHYLDEGEGDIPLLLVHGLPTSSFLWRKMIPKLSENNRVIAIDLPNFGKSSKTGTIPCSGDYAEWINEFISTLGIDKVVLLNHDMGGFSGGLFAARNPEKVAGVAMFEVVFTGPMPQAFIPPFLSDLRGNNADEFVINDNFFIETLLFNNDFNGKSDPVFGRSSYATLTAEEVAEFRKPFLDPNSRKALHFDRDCLGILEIDDQNRVEFAEIATYFQNTDVPRLVLFGSPSFVLPGDSAPPGVIDPVTNLPITMRNIITGKVSDQAGAWKNTTSVSVYNMSAPTLHFWQNETNGAPEEAATSISSWLSTL